MPPFWITDFLPHEQTVSIAAIIEQGAEVMKQTLESSKPLKFALIMTIDIRDRFYRSLWQEQY